MSTYDPKQVEAVIEALKAANKWIEEAKPLLARGGDCERQLTSANATIAELRADRHEALEIWCLTAQLMSGWMHDESWGAHDQSIYDRMIKLQRKWDDAARQQGGKKS